MEALYWRTHERRLLGEQTRELQLQLNRERTLASDAQRLREESQRLALDLAGVNGQPSAATGQVSAIEERARAAEARLDRVLADARRMPNPINEDTAPADSSAGAG